MYDSYKEIKTTFFTFNNFILSDCSNLIKKTN